MTRVNLPGWYGLGSGLAALDDVEQAREAYREWPVFAALVDVAEMSLAKTDDRLAEQFLALGGRPDLAERVLDELARTRREVLRLLDQDEMLERKPHLHTAVRLRRPFVDMLSHLQLRGLSEVRAHGEEAAAGVAPATAADHQRPGGGAAEHRLSGPRARRADGPRSGRGTLRLRQGGDDELVGGRRPPRAARRRRSPRRCAGCSSRGGRCRP